MLQMRFAEERGRTELGWLDSRHSFSFGHYYDPDHMSFRALRVLNDDRVVAGAGFGTHGHRDMEILSYVLEGALEHEDSSGGGGVILPGQIQFMRAGTGVTHSEYNHSRVEPVHFLQIWLVPDQRGLTPAYAERAFDTAAAERGFVLLASPDGRHDSIRLHQDAELRVARIDAGESRELAMRLDRHAWVHVARGAVALNGTPLREGDAAAASSEPSLSFVAQQSPDGGNAGDARPSEVLVFDLA